MFKQKCELFCAIFIICNIFIIDGRIIDKNIQIKCSFKLNESWITNKEVKYDTCTSEPLIIEIPNTKIDEVVDINGEMLQNQSTIEGFRIYGEQIKFFPGEIKTNFPSLIAFSLWNSEVAFLKQDDLIQFGDDLELFSFNNNKISAIFKDTFFYNENLKYIFLSGNPITYISDNSFSSLNNLQILSFENIDCLKDGTQYFTNGNYFRNSINQFDNYIKGCKQFEDTSLETYKNQNSLESNERLKSTMINLEAALKSKEKDNTYKKVNMTCHIKNASDTCEIHQKIDHKNFEVETIIFDFEFFKDNNFESDEDENDSMIRKIIIEDNLFMYFPLNIATFSQISNVEVMSIKSSGLVSFDDKDLESFLELKQIDFSYNILTSIPKHAFKFNTKLEDINLNGNMIAKLDVGLFSSLNQLKILKLRYNKLKYISPDILHENQNLIRFDLRDNKCINMMIPKQSKSDTEMKIIDSCLTPKTLMCAYKNETCYVQNLEIIHPRTEVEVSYTTTSKSSLDDVKILNATDQKTKFIPRDISKILINLEEIIIENSGLSALLSLDFSGFAKLIKVQITNNNITKIDENVFADLKNLETLDLSANNIFALPDNLLTPLTKLKVLILSSNKIVRFKVEFLPKKNMIQEFYIDRNQLEFFHTRTLKHLRKSKVIDLSGNVCIDQKYDDSIDNAKKLMEISGFVDFNCSDDI